MSFTDALEMTSRGECPRDERRGMTAISQNRPAPLGPDSIFYFLLALDPAYVEGCLERIGEDDPDGEQLFRDL
jgi:hypothetical protein